MTFGGVTANHNHHQHMKEAPFTRDRAMTVLRERAVKEVCTVQSRVFPSSVLLLCLGGGDARGARRVHHVSLRAPARGIAS